MLQRMVGIGAGIVAYLVFRNLPPDVSIPLIAGGLAGTVVGLLPYFLAKRQERMTLARAALWSCAGAGLVLGLLLALPIAVVFTIVILATKPTATRVTQSEPGVEQSYEPPPIDERDG